MNETNKSIVVAICCLSTISVLFGQESNANLQDAYQLHINKTTTAIKLDGRLDELAWKEAEVGNNFWMSFPVDDRRAEQSIQTEVMATYDDQNIYFAAICKGPNDYIIQSLKRDNDGFWDGDAFSILLDPVNEKTNGFIFAVNPANVQFEALVTGQTGRRGSSGGGGISRAWDNKWFSVVTQHVDHWVVEMAIPFKSIRYDTEQKTWGLNFVRGEPRTNSFHTWSPVPVQFVGVDLGFTGALLFDANPPSTKSNISLIPYVLGNTVKDFEENGSSDFDGRVGMDAKIAITPSLNLDLTINPDFSQVEVDQQVTNLTAFNIRFPERRLFFLENSDLFSDFGIPPMRPFFSRRIGLDEDGNPIRLQYGARLSGNITKDLRIGIMNTQTAEEGGMPGNNYSSLVMHHRVLKRSVIRGYFHNRQGRLDGDFQNDNFNRTAGLEFNFRTLDGKWRAFGGYGLSFTDNISNNKNAFFNVGGGFDNRNWSLYSNIAGVGNNYYADLGFIPLHDHYDAVRDTSIHVGFLHWFSRASYTYFPKNNPKIISHTWAVRDIYDISVDGDFINNRLFASYVLRWQNTSSLELIFSNLNTALLFPFDFTDDDPLPAQKYTFNRIGANYQTDQRKLLSTALGFEVGEFYNGTREQYTLNLRYRRQPWGNFDLRFEQNTVEFPEEYGSIDLFLIGPRIEINFSNLLSWTTFLQYNTQRDNFNINSRIQWRFQPMSDLFIVYTDNYFIEPWIPKNRALVVKANYWFNL